MADPAWLAVARGEDGVRETAGRKANPRITDYFQATGWEHRVKDDAVPWCSAFANWVMKQAGYNGTHSLAARSWLAWGRPIKPRMGAIMVFKRGNSDWQGHVAFYVGEDDTHYHVLGGNQRNGVNVARYPKASFLGARWPTSSMGTSRVVQAQVATGGASMVGLVSEAATEIKPIAEQAGEWINWMPLVAFACALIGVGCTIYFKWRAIKDGGG